LNARTLLESWKPPTEYGVIRPLGCIQDKILVANDPQLRRSGASGGGGPPSSRCASRRSRSRRARWTCDVVVERGRGLPPNQRGCRPRPGRLPSAPGPAPRVASAGRRRAPPSLVPAVPPLPASAPRVAPSVPTTRRTFAAAVAPPHPHRHSPLSRTPDARRPTGPCASVPRGAETASSSVTMAAAFVAGAGAGLGLRATAESAAPRLGASRPQLPTAAPAALRMVTSAPVTTSYSGGLDRVSQQPYSISRSLFMPPPAVIAYVGFLFCWRGKSRGGGDSSEGAVACLAVAGGRCALGRRSGARRGAPIGVFDGGWPR